MIDTHTHLDIKNYDNDRAETIARAFDFGVTAMINVGDNLATSEKSIALAKQYDRIYAAVGMHPYEFNDLSKIEQQKKHILAIENLAREKNVVAVGEIGLDYHSHTKEPITKEQKKNQKDGFLAQLQIAKQFNLPVIIHCRDAYDDVYDLITQHRLPSDRSITKCVLHCYAGGVEITNKFLAFPELFFSFTGNVTYIKPIRKDFNGLTENEKVIVKKRSDRDSQILEVLKMIPPDRIMAETDGPFLAPVPFRGKRNEPIHVQQVIAKLAEIKGFSFDELEKMTDHTAKHFFGI